MDSNNLFRSSPIPSFVYNVNTFQILDVNNSAIKQYGYSIKEFLSMSIKDIVFEIPNSKILVNQNAKYDIKEDKSIANSILIKKNGEKIKIEVFSNEFIFNGIKAVMISCIEKTEKKIKSFEALPDLSCLFDFFGNINKINKAGCEILEYSKHEINGENFIKFIHPDDKKDFIDKIQKLSFEETVLQFESRYISKSGKIIWLNWHCNSNIELGVIYAYAKNITEKNILKDLAHDAYRLALIGGWEFDFINNKIKWSDMIHEIYETNPKTFVPDIQLVKDFYKEEFRNPFYNIYKRVTEKGGPFDFEGVIITANGNEKWVRTIGKSEFVNGKCVRLYGSFQDISERKILNFRLKEILGSIKDAFYSVDKNWNFTYFNEESEKLLKQKSSDIIGRNIWEVFHQAKGTEIEKVYKKVAKNNIAESFEYYYSGDNCWYEIIVYPSNGGISAYHKNINEKKKVAEELKKLYNEKSRILESIGDAFFTVDSNFNVTYWNNVAELLLGVKREKILGRNLWEVFPDAVNTHSYINYMDALEKNKPINFEDFYGVWLEINAYPNEEGLTVLLKDISLRKETDLKIREANERFNKVSEATADAIWDWDIQKNYFYLGQGFKNIFGEEYLNEMTENDFWKDSIHKEDLPKIIQSINDAINNPSVSHWEMEYRVHNSSSEIKTVLDKGLIIRDENGKATRMVGAITDISMIKEHEQELKILNESLNRNLADLKLANEELEQFAFMVSHDLQEPLRMISSFMGMIKKKYGDQLDEKANQYIYYAIDGAKRMKKIILGLLDYSRAGRIVEETQIIDLNEFIENYKSLRRKVIAEKSVKLIINELPTIEANLSPIIQVFHALLDNAIKYSNQNIAPIVELTVKEETEEWIFSIKDNGIGIDNQFLDKIFVIFQRLHDRDQYKGTGIGLAIVKKHVESWGGRIWVTSELGKGSEFCFSILKK